VSTVAVAANFSSSGACKIIQKYVTEPGDCGDEVVGNEKGMSPSSVKFPTCFRCGAATSAENLKGSSAVDLCLKDQTNPLFGIIKDNLRGVRYS
jgi:hypothetical protein